MVKKSEATKARLLRAATEEFAAYGVAGARVDRIAATAGANKTLIYNYFGNKEELFDVVYEAAINEWLAAVPFDAQDLPGYAGTLFDFYRTHPHLIRLARWHALERPTAPPLPVATGARADKVKALRKAQYDGKINAGLPPDALLTLVQSLAGTWSDGAPEGGAPAADPEGVSDQRHCVVVAVARLTRPVDGTTPGPLAPPVAGVR
ncbi:AcrR family transcriptional regulator [Crossiella equi]|uniref:AcrR family transcriptional regulator n=1 Tax=Crossiella equi TaxID=130796 RepID=A0ABS5AR80_9PSEU|nr:TetR family transcriptional regulator [Crossiella equi]MBP2478917.1 AcrR family transcriptional regulator [Crossiella equi]